MNDSQDTKKHWWQSIPVFITATAGLLSAIAGLFAILNQTIWRDKAVDRKSSAALEVQPTLAIASPTSGTKPKASAARLVTPMSIIVKQDGTTIQVRTSSLEHLQTGKSLILRSGQTVELNRIKRIEVIDRAEADDHIGIRLTLRDDLQLEDTINSGLFVFSLKGVNDIGPIEVRLSDLKSVDIAN